MQLVDAQIDRYLTRLAAHDDPVLGEMHALAAEKNFPIIGPQVGRLISLLASTAGAKRVLELGSGFGYSAWWFGHAVGADGHITLTEGAEDNCERARDYLTRAGLIDRVSIHCGNGLEIAQQDDSPVDIVFCDIDKEDYPQALPIALERLRVGGLFIIDNMLWQGRVIDANDTTPTTAGVLELTRLLQEDSRFQTTLLPVRDGVMVARRTGA